MGSLPLGLVGPLGLPGVGSFLALELPLGLLFPLCPLGLVGVALLPLGLPGLALPLGLLGVLRGLRGLLGLALPLGLLVL